MHLRPATARALWSLHSQEVCFCSDIFPGVSYGTALATLKVAALALGFPKAESWGTHAFRRGWADEALMHGGVPALFLSGGWRGVAAFGYASAQAKGAMQAAEWLVEFTDSSGSD